MIIITDLVLNTSPDNYNVIDAVAQIDIISLLCALQAFVARLLGNLVDKDQIALLLVMIPRDGTDVLS